MHCDCLCLKYSYLEDARTTAAIVQIRKSATESTSMSLIDIVMLDYYFGQIIYLCILNSI